MIPVLAPPRSCSSLITAMLGQHPELYATAELECFTADNIAGCLAFAQRVPIVTTHGLLRSVAQLLVGEQSNVSVTAARQWLDERQHWSGAELVRWIEVQIAPRRLLEKSPIHVLRWESLQRLVDVTENQPVLHLTRHPVSAMISMSTAYQRDGKSLLPGEALRTWIAGHLNIMRWLEMYPNHAALCVRCEDLLSNPENELHRIADHLGVSSGPGELEAMLQPEQSPYACVGPSLAPSGNDPHWLASPALRRRPVVADPESVQPLLGNLWDRADLQPELVFQAVQLGWQLGYK
ncbi:MAG: sulfotransferase [Cyanobacteria bacterium]|nr:sulfotransferase [Cyanobacteriota bacterium]